MGRERTGRESVQSLERALSILVVLGQRDEPVGVTWVANRLELPKSTVHRLLSTLERAGFAARSPEGRYALGTRLWELGQATGQAARPDPAPHDGTGR